MWKKSFLSESKPVPDVSQNVIPEPQVRDDRDDTTNDESTEPQPKWSTTLLILTYFWLLGLLQWLSIEEEVANSLSVYITSDFNYLSSSPAVSQAAYIISGVIDIPLAKIIEIWGLDIGFALMSFLNALGLLMVTVCKNITTYTTAKVFYQVGFHGLGYTITVFVAESTNKKYRGMVLSITCVHSIASAFAGPAFAQRFEEHSTFRWAFAILLIVSFVMCLPVFAIIRYHKKAEDLDLEKPNRPWLVSIKDYFFRIDAVGVVLFCSGLTLFFMPWSLVAKQDSGWTSPSILVMIILGFCLILAFFCWEAFFSQRPFVPLSCLKNRNVLGTCMLTFGLGLSNYCWNPYFRTVLQVVNGQSISSAGYIANIYWDGIAVGSIVAGVVLRFAPRYKALSLFALAMDILGSGLMIKYSRADTKIGYIIMCQIFMAFSAGITNITTYISLMESKSNQSTALLFGLSALSSNIGIVVGQSISGGIWTNVLPRELHRHLPADLQSKIKAIMDSIRIALKYPVGSTQREAIDVSIAAVQRLLLISGTSILVIPLVGVLMWRRS